MSNASCTKSGKSIRRVSFSSVAAWASFSGTLCIDIMTEKSKPLDKTLFYNTTVEIFIALRDVDYTYYLDDCQKLTSSLKQEDRFVVVYWEPPGALRNVELSRTEILFRNKNPKFATKTYLEFDKDDCAAILLTFRVSYWSSIRVSLQKIVDAGPKGLDLPLHLQLEPSNKYTDAACASVIPGRLFLRAEIMQQINRGMFLQFGFLRNNLWLNASKYYLELHKLNEQHLFEIACPYTLVTRTEPAKLTKESETDPDTFYSQPNFLMISRLCNGDYDRVLKIEIHKDVKKHPSFALTTLKDITENKRIVIPVNKRDGSIVKNYQLVIRVTKEIHMHSFEYYLSKGLHLKRIYAVDYSVSNARVGLHRRNLHDNFGDQTPYEGALQIVAETMMNTDDGDSVFYSFGNFRMDQHVASFPQAGHVNSLLDHYREALCNSKLGAMDLNASTVMLASSSCLPVKCTPLSSSKKTYLNPLLKDISTLLSFRMDKFEYNNVFIFTDGEISDIQETMESMANLAALPISLIFIGIGAGDFHQLLELERAWTIPQKGIYPCRSIARVIHFRSILEWTSAVQFANYKASPFEILQKEIMSTIRDQAVAYMKLFKKDV